MTNYIAGIDIIENNDRISLVKIKRHSNQKWYTAKSLLESIKNSFEMSEGKIKGQFFSEYKEIRKICATFSIKVPTKLICKQKSFDNE